MVHKKTSVVTRIGVFSFCTRPDLTKPTTKLQLNIFTTKGFTPGVLPRASLVLHSHIFWEKTEFWTKKTVTRYLDYRLNKKYAPKHRT